MVFYENRCNEGNDVTESENPNENKDILPNETVTQAPDPRVTGVTSPPDAISDISNTLAVLDGVRQDGAGALADCPACGRRRLLHIRAAIGAWNNSGEWVDGGEPLLYCLGGCSHDEIARAIAERRAAGYTPALARRGGFPRPADRGPVNKDGTPKTYAGVSSLDYVGDTSRDFIVVDYETETIGDGTPKPVGVAVSIPVGDGRQRERFYLSWGHPTGNNVTINQARERLRDIYNRPVVFHNAMFDIDVGQTHLGLPLPHNYACTMTLAFLADPFASSLALKEYFDRRYGTPPAERDELRAWIVDNIPAAKQRKTKWQEFIAQCPGDVVARYAIGDVLRPERLFIDLKREIDAAGIADAYAREMRLIPVLLAMSRRGVPIDRDALEQALTKWEPALEGLTREASRMVGLEPSDLDKRERLADALERRGLVNKWELTANGARKTSIESLRRSLKPEAADFIRLFKRRSNLKTTVATFMKPWLEMSARDGLVHPQWNPVRQADWSAGARTGRLSSKPNLQNVVKDAGEEGDNLPNLRGFIAARPGEVLLDRDYRQQELRILAHFECGRLLQAYQQDPSLDMHDQARARINEMLGTNYERRPIKNTGFAIIYGGGAGRIAEMNGTDKQTGARLRRSYLEALPGVKTLIDGIGEEFAADRPIRTWGGRRYFCEPPREVDGRTWTFEYKGLNYLIQGSAADCIKQVMIDAHSAGVRLILTVHDQLVALADDDRAPRDMELLREAMESVEFGLPMPTDGKSGQRWGELRADATEQSA